jgi:hypothetical protein
MARKPNRPSAEEIIVAIFDAEHSVRRLHEELRHVDRAVLLRTMAAAVAASLREQNERDAVVQQTCLAQILGQLTGDAAVDLLIDLFGSEHPEPQQIAGEALEQLSFDRFKEVALGIERALVRLPQSSPARSGFPYLLEEVPEPGVAVLLGKMLHQVDADAVCAAVEMISDRKETSLIPELEALKSDPRLVDIDDDEGETDQVQLGLLVTEALAELNALKALQGAE